MMDGMVDGMMNGTANGEDASADNPALALEIEPCDLPWPGEPTARPLRPERLSRPARHDPAHDALRMGAFEQRGGVLAEGELRCGGARVRVVGRALRLIAWLASRQERINQCAEESGQLWLTWKGDGAQSVTGDIRTRL